MVKDRPGFLGKLVGEKWKGVEFFNLCESQLVGKQEIIESFSLGELLGQTLVVGKNTTALNNKMVGLRQKLRQLFLKLRSFLQNIKIKGFFL